LISDILAGGRGKSLTFFYSVYYSEASHYLCPSLCWVRDPEPREGVSAIPELERADGRHLGGSDGLPLLRGGGTRGQGGEYII
jgi:hypothetical protein